MAHAINNNVYGKYINRATAVARLLLFAFAIVCVFDPADQVFGAKVWLFVALWGATCIAALSASDEISLPIGLVLCVLLFIVIPMLSILSYYLTSGTEPYAGFALLKSVLLVSLALVLVINRIDVVPFLSAALTLLALSTIGIFIALQLYPELFLILHDIGLRWGAVILLHRSYGEGLSFTQINFVTAPLLVISISHYFDRAMSEPAAKSKLAYLTLAAIGIVGMFFAASRNTMAVAVLLPLFLWPLYTRRVARNGLMILGALIAFCLPLIGMLKGFFDPEELSNNIKLTLLGDYAQIFSDPKTLLFGQGLGAYHRWSTSGFPDFEKTGAYFYFTTELTYAELIRSFGLLGAAIMMSLLFFPVAHGFFSNANTRQRALALGFLAYLCMTATNPLLFSSTGILLFSVMLASTFHSSDGHKSSSMSSRS